MKGRSLAAHSLILGALIVVALACTAAPASPGSTVSTPRQPSRPDTVEVPAPIESVQIEKVAAKPPNTTLIVVSGLPSSCYEFGAYKNVTGQGDTISAEVTNLKNADPDAPCAELYRTVESRIPLDDPGSSAPPIEACRFYDVMINGELHSAQAIPVAGLFEDPSARCSVPGTDIGGGDGDTVEALAPIDDVKVEIAESFPPQYFLVVTSGLPNGCVRFGSYDVKREGYTVTVKVTNLEPADKSLMCTMIYGLVETRIPLGSDLKPDKTYTIVVNDVVKSFSVGQGLHDGPRDSITTALDTRFQVKVGQTAVTEPDGIEIAFLEVLEDSRCPAKVNCIRAGRAVIVVSVAVAGQDLGQQQLTVEAGKGDSANIGDEYTVQLLVLQPFPDSPETPIEPANYVASMAVSKVPSGIPIAELSLHAEHLPDQPLTIHLVAELVGGSDNSQELYCQGWSWEFGDGMDVTAMPGCLPWTPDAKAPRHFEQMYTYDAPGTYQVTFSYGALESEPVVVEVQ